MLDSFPAGSLSDDQPHSGVSSLFAVDAVADGVWRSQRCDPRGGRLYGGALAAQLLAAARGDARPDLQVNNVDVRYLRPADGAKPIDYHVDAVQEGRTSAVGRVTALQEDAVVAVGSVAFHAPRDGWTHGRHPVNIVPDELPATGTPHRSRAVSSADFDIRYRDVVGDGPLTRLLCFRTANAQPAHAQVHECAVVYVSDIYLFEPLCLEHGYAADDRRLRYATTQHTVWFQRQPKVDEWLVLESHSPAMAGGRGVVYGVIRTLDGEPVATVMQEAVCWADERVDGQ